MKKLTAEEFAEKVTANGTEFEIDELRTMSLQKYNQEWSDEEIPEEEQVLVFVIYAHIDPESGDVKTEGLSGSDFMRKSRQTAYIMAMQRPSRSNAKLLLMIFTRSISNFWKIWNDTSPRPTGRGFLLPCTDTAQGFSFCPVAHKPHTSRLQRLSCCQCNYTATTSKAFTGLCSGLSADLPYSSAHGTAYTRAAYIPPAPRRTLCRPAQPPYYNKVYKGATVRLL